MVTPESLEREEVDTLLEREAARKELARMINRALYPLTARYEVTPAGRQALAEATETEAREARRRRLDELDRIERERPNLDELAGRLIRSRRPGETG